MPIFRVVEKATRYQAARWLTTVSSDAIWHALGTCWIDAYSEPPDIIGNDAGKQLMATMFHSNSKMLRIQKKSVPIETLISMSFVRRLHELFHHAYNILRRELPDIGVEKALHIEIKSVNDSVVPEGLVPILKVHGAQPRLEVPSISSITSTFKRAVAAWKATEEISK